MTVEHFAKMCNQSGYCGIRFAVNWCEVNGITDPSDSDFVNVYRANQRSNRSDKFRYSYTGHGWAKTTKRYTREVV